MGVIGMTRATRKTPSIPLLYKGLDPYYEEDAALFFGREEQRERLVDSLRSSRLTILYGARQVGKTSLIRAGLVSYLQGLSNRQRDSGSAEFGWVVFDDWSNDDVLGRLSAAIDQKIEKLGVNRIGKMEASPSFVELCQAWTKCLGNGAGELFLIFDQFEKYLLRNPRQNLNQFDRELHNIVTAQGLAVNVLISIRDDFLATLDRYRCNIPNLYDSLIRLEPLTEKQACDAILNPVYEFNPSQPSESKISIEYGLVAAVLESVTCDPESAELASAKTDGSTVTFFSPPAIQLVMKALWESKSCQKANKLGIETFTTELEGISGISRSYLDGLCQDFKTKDKNSMAKVFDVLATPGGLDLAFPLEQLAERAGVKKRDISSLVDKLCRIGLLDAVPQQGATPTSRYEIKYRILTKVLLDKVREWRKECADKEHSLDGGIGEANTRFERESQLCGLDQAIEATEGYLTAKEEGWPLSNSLEEKFRGTLQKICDWVSQTAQLGGYKGAVSSIAFGLNDSQIITGEETGALRIWDIDSRESWTLEPGHQNWIWALAVNKDESWLATGSDDGRVFLSMLEDRIPSPCYAIIPTETSGKANPVRGLSFSPRAPLLAIADNGGHIRIWNLESRALESYFVISQEKPIPVRCVEFSPDGNCVATGSDDGLLCLWSLDGKCLGNTRDENKGHAAEIWSLSFRPDGRCLASASQDHTIKLWNVENKSTPLFKETITGHSCGVLSVTFSPDGELIASGSEDGTACLWDRLGNKLAEFIHGGPVNDVAFGSEGTSLATAAADFRVRRWDVARGIQRERPAELCRHPGLATLFDLAISEDGLHLVASGTDNRIQLWDAGGKWIHQYTGHKGYILRVVFAPDGKTFATASFDGTARVWRLEGPQELAVLQHESLVLGLAYSPDGRQILTGSADGKHRLWDWQSPSQPAFTSSASEHGSVWSVRFNPRDSTLVCGYRDGTIICWSLEGEVIHEFTNCPQAPVLSLGFDKEGTRLASSTSNGLVYLWDPRTGEGRELKRFHAPVWSIAFSPNGKFLASGCLDRSVCVLDIGTGEKKALVYAEAPVRGVAFDESEGKERVIAACSDGTVKRWILGKNELEDLLKVARDQFQASITL